MINRTRFIIIYILIATAAFYINFHQDISVPMNRPFDEFPMGKNGWHAISQSHMDDDILNVLKPTDYLSRTYEGRDGGEVQLYIGFHNGGKDSGPIHSPKHCLPGGGWHEISSEKTQIDIDGKKLDLVKAVYKKGDIKEVFYYWFQVGDRTVSDEYSLKLAQIGNSMLHQRRDAAFIRVSVPDTTDENRSMDTGIQFIRDFYPVITDFLPA